jgi:iron complex transport system substrate-binding protein
VSIRSIPRPSVGFFLLWNARWPGAVLCCALALLGASCSSDGRESTDPSAAPGASRPPALADARSGAPAPLDGSAPGLAARHVVSLAPNITEILFALGLGDRIVGVTDYCNYPPAAARLPKVGGFVNPNPEAILALHPDLVVATPNVGNRPFVERLMAAGARVEVVQARDVSEIFPAIEAIAAACGAPAAGKELIAKLRADLAHESARVASLGRPKTLFCIQVEPLIAAGPGSYPADLLALAGAENVVPASAGTYPALSLEEVIRSAPELIVQSLMDSRDGASGSQSLLAFWGRWPSIPAVRTHRVRTLAGDLVLRPGPRVAQGVAALIDLVHPEADR